jgi:hypothetical protein
VGDGLAVMTEAYQRLHLDDLASTSLETLKLNYPDHPSLKDGQFVPQVAEADNRSWLSKYTLGLIESRPPLPPGETRANQDVIKQFQDAKEAAGPGQQPGPLVVQLHDLRCVRLSLSTQRKKEPFGAPFLWARIIALCACHVLG